MLLTATERDVLNATAESAENLESIYQSLRGSPRPVDLADVADAIRKLVEDGILAAQPESSDNATTPLDVSALWKSRFALTPQGQDVRAAAVSPDPGPDLPRSSRFGAWRAHRIKLSSADLDEARREMWADFPRDAPR